MTGEGLQNPDGSWSKAVPLGWQGHTLDFEVYTTESGFKANGYDEDMLIEVVTAKTRRQLNRRMKAAGKRHGMKVTAL